jgi:hypothetical protein
VAGKSVAQDKAMEPHGNAFVVLFWCSGIAALDSRASPPQNMSALGSAAGEHKDMIGQ